MAKIASPQVLANVGAGAVAAVYSNAEDITKQAVHILERIIFDDAPLSVREYPKYYRISINKRVASSLGYRDLSENALHAKLIKLEQDCHDMIHQFDRVPRQKITELKEENARQ